MAIVDATSQQHYQGLSSDEKPLGAPNGATLHIIDKGEMWVMHEGMWLLDLRPLRPPTVILD